MKIIRPVKLSDISDVYEVELEAFGSESYPYFVFRQAYDLFPQAFIVASDGAKTIGYCLGAQTMLDKNRGWILSLGTRSANRFQGYGTCLMEETLRVLKEFGCKEVLLTVRPDNIIAKGLFRKVGFSLVEVDDEYFGPGHPREIMKMRLVR